MVSYFVIEAKYENIKRRHDEAYFRWRSTQKYEALQVINTPQ